MAGLDTNFWTGVTGGEESSVLPKLFPEFQQAAQPAGARAAATTTDELARRWVANQAAARAAGGSAAPVNLTPAPVNLAPAPSNMFSRMAQGIPTIMKAPSYTAAGARAAMRGLAPALRWLPGVGQAAMAGMEGLDVLDAAAAPGATPMDVVKAGGKSLTRLGSMGAGTGLGALAFGPPGAVVGGTAGYFAPDFISSMIDKARGITTATPAAPVPGTPAPAAPVPGTPAPAAPAPTGWPVPERDMAFAPGAPLPNDASAPGSTTPAVAIQRAPITRKMVNGVPTFSNVPDNGPVVSGPVSAQPVNPETGNAGSNIVTGGLDPRLERALSAARVAAGQRIASGQPGGGWIDYPQGASGAGQVLSGNSLFAEKTGAPTSEQDMIEHAYDQVRRAKNVTQQTSATNLLHGLLQTKATRESNAATVAASMVGHSVAREGHQLTANAANDTLLVKLLGPEARLAIARGDVESMHAELGRRLLTETDPVKIKQYTTAAASLNGRVAPQSPWQLAQGLQPIVQDKNAPMGVTYNKETNELRSVPIRARVTEENIAGWRRDNPKASRADAIAAHKARGLDVSGLK